MVEWEYIKKSIIKKFTMIKLKGEIQLQSNRVDNVVKEKVTIELRECKGNKRIV